MTFSSGTTFSRVVTVKYRTDAPGTLKVTCAQTAGAGSITMQAAALSTLGGSATLTWQPPALNVDGTPLTNLAAFKVYWGTTQGTYPNGTEHEPQREHLLERLAQDRAVKSSNAAAEAQGP